LDPARLRRRARARKGFNVQDIPTIKMNWTGDEKVRDPDGCVCV
jgi:hypothetical protein